MGSVGNSLSIRDGERMEGKGLESSRVGDEVGVME